MRSRSFCLLRSLASSCPILVMVGSLHPRHAESQYLLGVSNIRRVGAIVSTMTTPTLTGQSLGVKLRASRILAGLDQQQMADALNVGRSTVSGWERDKFEPVASSLFGWAQVTNQPLSWFAEGLDSVDVRPKRLELPTFCMGVKAWTVADDLALMLFTASERVNGDL